MNSLQEQIIEANEAYRTGEPIITDQQYDDLLDLLESQMGMIEFEDFKQTLTESKGTIKLDYVLGSLTKYKYEEPENLYKWIKKHSIKSIFASLKVDGCSFNASYRNGILVMCSSRGDGDTGTDWTEKAKYILPTTISYKENLDIRGEFTLTGDSHVALGYKSRRVGTVGIMNQDEIVPAKLKHVKAVYYEVLSGNMNISVQFAFLEKNGFMNTPTAVVFTGISDSDHLHESLKKFYTDIKATLDYDVDGLVLSPPDYQTENVFYPERKIAFKMNQEGVETTVIGIEWNISKGGLLKPIILIEPTEISGSTIQRVTGIHAQNISLSNIGKGAIIKVRKSGEVIPEVTEVVKIGSINLPTVCPSCGMQLQWKSVDLVCTNINCKDKNVKEVASFLIKNGVENVTDTSLTNWGVTTFSDLLSFTSDGSKSQDKFTQELTKNIFSKTKEELFSNMSFDGAGKTNIDKLLEHYGEGNLVLTSKFLYFNNGNTELFDKIGYPEGIGCKIIDKIKNDWVKNLDVIKMIISDPRYNPKPKVAKVVATGNLSGQSFLLTGTLSEGRKQIEKLITDNGGSIASSVSKTLSVLVCGPDSWGSSSKYTKAEKLGVKIITEDQLKGMI